MKNPWMSLWMSAANRAAGTARGLWLAEAGRQRRALAKGVAKGLAPTPAQKKRGPARRRSK